MERDRSINGGNVKLDFGGFGRQTLCRCKPDFGDCGQPLPGRLAKLGQNSDLEDQADFTLTALGRQSTKPLPGRYRHSTTVVLICICWQQLSVAMAIEECRSISRLHI